jgi:hypothetical protein
MVLLLLIERHQHLWKPHQQWVRRVVIVVALVRLYLKMAVDNQRVFRSANSTLDHIVSGTLISNGDAAISVVVLVVEEF